MSFTNDVIAALALALVCPAILFVAALFLRQVAPLESEPARRAGRIVAWYAAHPQLALWVLLLLLPLSSLVLGTGALLRTWGDNPRLQDVTWRALAAIPAHWPAISIGGATLLAFAIVVMITAHLFRESPNHPGGGEDVRQTPINGNDEDDSPSRRSAKSEGGGTLLGRRSYLISTAFHSAISPKLR
jgi:hypothetical protein